MKIYSQGDQAIVVAIEKEVSKSLTEDLLTLRSYLIEKKLSIYYRNCAIRIRHDDCL